MRYKRLMLNRQGLIRRAKQLFSGVEVWIFRFIPLILQPDLDKVNEDWIRQKMEHFGIR